jgi:hypothetical protein
LHLAWVDFRFRGHRFLMNIHDGHYCLFVRNPQCSDLVLYQVGCHFEKLLLPARKATSA